MSLNLNSQARAVVSALKSFDMAAAKTGAQICLAFQTMVDTAIKAGVNKDEAGVKSFMKDIRDAEPFEEAVALGLMERKTVTEYAQSAGRAFFHNVPFAQNLKNDESMKLPWGKAGKGGTTGKAGKVESTSRAEVDATARKLLKQLRLIGLTELAADTLDLLVERLEGFTETEPTKQ